MANADRITLRPSRRQLAGLLVPSLVFAGVGLSMVLRGRPFGWWLAAGFGCVSLAGLLLLSPQAAYLRLERDRFTLCTFFRRLSIPWTDVLRFRVVQLSGHPAVVFDLKPSVPEQRLSRRTASALAGADGLLPETYGLEARAMALLLNQWRSRAERALIDGPVPPSAT